MVELSLLEHGRISPAQLPGLTMKPRHQLEDRRSREPESPFAARTAFYRRVQTNHRPTAFSSFEATTQLPLM
jgi:hypothetical protein